MLSDVDADSEARAVISSLIFSCACFVDVDAESEARAVFSFAIYYSQNREIRITNPNRESHHDD